MISLSVSQYSQSRFDEENKLTNALVAEGFNNVAVLVENRQVIITYENLVYRYEPDALKQVYKIADDNIHGVKDVVVVIQKRGIPISAAILKSGNPELLKQEITTTFEIDKYWEKLEKRERVNGSELLFECIIHPQVKALFGDFEDPVKLQLNIAPAIQTLVFSGFLLYAQTIFPLHNELSEQGDYIRPGVTIINYFNRLPFDTFFSTSAGYFTNNRYGVDFEMIKFFLDGRVFLGFNYGYTGYAAFINNELYYTHMERENFSVIFGYYWDNPYLLLKGAWGKTLYGGYNFRTEIQRYFDEIIIGFFYEKSAIGQNAGFNFQIPLFPEKYMSEGLIRIRMPECFWWESRYNAKDYGKLNYQKGENTTGHLKYCLPNFLNIILFNEYYR